MERVVLNGARMATREKAHAHIRKRFRFPDYYGCNLDALHDCLTDVSVPTEILLRNSRPMQAKLGDYATKLLSVLAASTGENPRLSLTVRQGFFR